MGCLHVPGYSRSLIHFWYLAVLTYCVPHQVCLPNPLAHIIARRGVLRQCYTLRNSPQRLRVRDLPHQGYLSPTTHLVSSDEIRTHVSIHFEFRVLTACIGGEGADVFLKLLCAPVP